MSGLLFIAAGLPFAAGDLSDGEGSLLEEAREDLERELMGRPGIAGMAHLEDEGIIIVFVENEQAKGEVPDRFEGFHVHKQVTGGFQALSGQSSGRTEAGFGAIPLRSLQVLLCRFHDR